MLLLGLEGLALFTGPPILGWHHHGRPTQEAEPRRMGLRNGEAFLNNASARPDFPTRLQPLKDTSIFIVLSYLKHFLAF